VQWESSELSHCWPEGGVGYRPIVALTNQVLDCCCRPSEDGRNLCTGPFALDAVDMASAGGYFIVPEDFDPSPLLFHLAAEPESIVILSFPAPVEVPSAVRIDAKYDVERALLFFLGLRRRSPRLSPLPGDLDFYLRVDLADFLILSENYGCTNAAWPDGDLDWDRRVGFSDFLILSENFDSQPQLAAVPEPSTGFLAMLAVGGLGVCRRRRELSILRMGSTNNHGAD